MLVVIHVFNLLWLLDSIFMHFGCQVEVSLGANIAGVLRGVGASWKPTADFDGILIHF